VASDDEKAKYSGRLASYSAGGFVRELRQGSFKSVHYDVDELYRKNWIDHSTRAVFLELTVYNPHLRIFCAIKYDHTRCNEIKATRNVPKLPNM